MVYYKSFPIISDYHKIHRENLKSQNSHKVKDVEGAKKRGDFGEKSSFFTPRAVRGYGEVGKRR